VSEARLALKVDCDTYQGTRRGLPVLLRLFDHFKIRASFFFTLGPDYSGRAIWRIVRQRGFLSKMIRTRALPLYGVRTGLYGTLLPAPRIGQKLSPLIRSVGEAGHEVGVHGWDHVRWHDRLDRMSEEDVARDYGDAQREFSRIFGRRARASAAPGWQVTPTALTIQERYQLLYSSNTRGGAPFFPVAAGRRFSTLEIPTTLPTWDEVLGPGASGADGLLARYRPLASGTSVHSIHTEVEGGAHAGSFRRLIEGWQSDGVEFVTLERIAQETLENRSAVPTRSIVPIELPGRAGVVMGSEPG